MKKYRIAKLYGKYKFDFIRQGQATLQNERDFGTSNFPSERYDISGCSPFALLLVRVSFFLSFCFLLFACLPFFKHVVVYHLVLIC